MAADSEWDDRNPALGTSALSTLILAYHRQGNYDEKGNFVQGEQNDPARVQVMVTRSYDEGLTWEPPVPLGVDSLTSDRAVAVLWGEAALIAAVEETED